MKKTTTSKIPILFFLFLLLLSADVLAAPSNSIACAPTIGTTTFDGMNTNIAPYGALPKSGIVDCWEFKTTGTGSGSINHNGANNPSNVNFFVQTASSISIKSSDGGEFDLNSFRTQWYNFSGTYTISAYKDGTFIGSTTNIAGNSYTTVDLSSYSYFNNIDEFIFTGFGGSNVTINLDEITIGAATISSPPIIDTSAPLSVTATGATLSGNVINNGGASVDERGFVYSSSDNSPTIGKSGVTQIIVGNGAATFEESVSGLNSSTTYYYQAYATNSVGTTYGGVESFTTLADEPVYCYPTIEMEESWNNISRFDIPEISFSFNLPVDENNISQKDNLATTISLTSGKTYSFEIETMSMYGIGVAADFNNDGDFDDPEEIMSDSMNSYGTGIQISIPDGVSVGNYRLRLYTSHSPCGYQMEGNYADFTLEITAPMVTTTSVSGLTETTATVGGNIINNDGVTINERGIVYNATGSPSTVDNKIQIGTGDGVFSKEITELISGAQYFVRAYAISNAGTYYGSEERFVTLADVVYCHPTYNNETTRHYIKQFDIPESSFRYTLPYANVETRKNNLATVVNLSKDQNYSFQITTVGWTGIGVSVDFNKDGDFLDTNEILVAPIYEAGSDGTNTYDLSLSIPAEISAGNYRMRLWNALGNSGDGTPEGSPCGIYNYGTYADFTLLIAGISATTPTLTTTPASDITATTAALGGTVTDDGGASVIERGIVYSTAGNPTTSHSKVQIGTGEGSFLQKISNLTAETNYFVRAYAINGEGTSYGNEESFTTTSIPVPPEFTSTPITQVGYGQEYLYAIAATEEAKETTAITPSTFPNWLIFSADGQSEATGVGNIPDGTQISGVTGDADGNIYAATIDGTTIYKIDPNGTTTEWRSGLESGIVNAIHIAGDYLYIPRHGNQTHSITRIPLNNPDAVEEIFATFSGGTMSVTDKGDWIYAANYVNREILRIHKTDKTVETILTSTDGLPASGPFGLALDKNNNLYIATNQNRSILKYDGIVLSTVLGGLSSSPTSVKVDENGNFYISIQDGGIRKYDSNWSNYTYVSSGTRDNIWSTSFTSTGALVFGIKNTNQVYRLQTGAVLTGTPAKSDLGTHPVLLEASNSVGIVQQAFSIEVLDNIAPVVQTYSPANNATEVVVQPTLSIILDEEVVLGSAGTLTINNGATVLRTYDLAVPEDQDAITLSDDNLTLSIDLDSNLPVNTAITVGLSGGFVKDQAGNEFTGFTPQSSTWRFTTINKVDQTIIFPEITSKAYGDEPFILGDKQTDKGHTITYTAADPSVVTITGNQATILKAGTTTITATQEGNETTFPAEDVTRSLNIAKKDLQVSAKDMLVECGDEAGEFAFEISGLAYGDTTDALDNTDFEFSTDYTVPNGTGTYPLQVTLGTASDDNYNFTNFTSGEIEVVDTSNPLVVTKNITVQLNEQGTAIIVPADIDNGSTDNCEIESRVLDITSFDCTNVGTPVEVTLTVNDANGNSETGTAMVTVEDNVAPVVTTVGTLTVQLDENGEAVINADDIDNGSTDNCDIASRVLDISIFDCSNVGTPVEVTLTVTDVNGISKTGTALVTVEDNVAPVVTTVGTLTVQLDENGEASITVDDIDKGSKDNCGIESRVLDITSFDCSNVGTPSEVTLTVTDVNGISETGTALVTVEDNMAPEISTVSTLTVQLDDNGKAIITVDDIDNRSTDNCDIEKRELDITSFNCSNVGTPVEVTLTVTDVNGNSESGTALVAVEDNIDPEVATQNITVQLDENGEASIVPADINDGSTDNCAIQTYSLDVDSFTCADVNSPITVTLTVKDVNGNSASETATVTVEDNMVPVVATKDVTVELNANGEASIVPADINDGSTDNCAIQTYGLDIDSFTCTDVNSPVTVTLTVKDVNGNSASETATVTVEDNMVPVVATQNITVELDANGEASIVPADINDGSTDNCEIDTYGLDVDSFTCADVNSPVTVTLTVKDVNGNSASETATVTVKDNINPVVIAKDFSIQLNDQGKASITVEDVVESVSDNCTVENISLSQYAFDCSSDSTNQVVVTVTDAYGNSTTAEVTISVLDEKAPVVVAKDIVVELDEKGVVSINPEDVLDESLDNCGIGSIDLDLKSFGCEDVGFNVVVLTVTDHNGNTGTAEAIVEVVNNSGDTDADGLQDNCDEDDDNDGIPDEKDNSPFHSNSHQIDTDGDGEGDVSDTDDDNDGVRDEDDNCPLTSNPDQADINKDGLGDVCDTVKILASEGLTPNGDGINDTWRIINIENHPNSIVQVYNRWGKQVFFARGYRNDWNGKYEGNMLPEGSYYYQVDLNGDGIPEQDGWLYLTK